MTDRPLASINIPSFDSKPREVAEVWRLSKGNRSASCAIWTHVTRKGEICLLVNGELHRSEALNDGLELVDLALEWWKQFAAKGWA